MTPLTQRRYANPEYLERILSRIPMSRVGTADDIAYGVLPRQHPTETTGTCVDSSYHRRKEDGQSALREPGRPNY